MPKHEALTVISSTWIFILLNSYLYAILSENGELT